MIDRHETKCILRACLRAGRRLGLAVLLLVAAAAQGAGDAVNMQVVEDTGDRIVVTYELIDYDISYVVIDGQSHAVLTIDREPQMLAAGAPDLPRICRSLRIPDDARMTVAVRDAVVEQVGDIDIAPSKGALLRTVNPKDVPFTFGPAYAPDALWPAERALLRAPYILRRQRGAVLEIHPFQYNPQSRVLEICRRATIEITREGVDTVNVLDDGLRGEDNSLAFEQIYRNHFINYASGLRYAPLDEQGDMLIIAHDAWIANVQPLAAHHTARGIDTTVVGVSTIGNNATAIKNYIQNVYNSSDLAFVLLVGDSSHVATPTASGGSSDPSYAKLAGSDDYPDILIGRFSAESAADVDTQVERTMAYETTPVYDEPWFRHATGIASTEGPGDDGEDDDEHMDNIRTDLLGYGYTTVDQFYGYGASSSQVATALNAGRGLINYTGHGSRTAWSTTGFSVSNVNSLTNVGMLPFIFDVACVNGQFAGGDCFAEAWLRATHNGAPTGAVGIYASSINQSWDPPMAAQDECVDLLVAESYVSFGALCFAGSSLMMDEYGANGVEMYDTWHVFGDPALPVRLNGPFAPTADDVRVDVLRNTSANFALLGNDNDNDPLSYIVTSLPQHGEIVDLDSGIPIVSTPYLFAAGAKTLAYTPDADYIGSDYFMYKVNDGTPPPDGGDSNVAVVRITVMAPPPVITTAALPDGVVGMPYGPVTLNAADGQPALSWSIVTNAAYVEENLGVCGFAETGEAQGWHIDDQVRTFVLPFLFPFYGEEEDTIRISGNGFIAFGVPDVTYSNSLTGLKRNRMIAPLWDDLKTTVADSDIYIDASIPGAVTVRWAALTYTGDYPVNVSVTLSADGGIEFDYGPGNAPVSATVGISAGDEARYTISDYDGVSPLTSVNSVRFFQPNGLPDGMEVAPNGVFSGAPAEAGDFEPVFRVTDSLGRSDERMIDLHVADFVAGNADFDGDGDVDLADFAGFQRCFTGRDVGPARSGCEMFYTDPDSDVDMDDYESFRTKFEQ